MIRKDNINQISKLLLILGIFSFILDFILATILGIKIGFTTQIDGWVKFGTHPIWVELITIFILLSFMTSIYLAFNSKRKLQENILSFFGIDNDKFLTFINPYLLVFVDFAVLYKIFSMYLVNYTKDIL